MKIVDIRRSIQTLKVYPGSALRVSEGVARGDAISFADELVMDDYYTLSQGAERETLHVALGPRLKTFRIQDQSPIGHPGNGVVLDSCITLMDNSGTTCEALILVEISDNMAESVYVLPLAPLEADHAYRLVGIDRHSATRRFAQIACVSFGKGTRITMADGNQRPIEDLRPGDLVLTRDNGVQPLRWLGVSTLRASGAFAPVLIRAGALNNAGDLLVSPDHRIMVYQREDKIGAGRPDILVKVRHLVDGDAISRQVGGHVEYYQMLFDHHEIIYAEGIASESLYIDHQTRELLPDEVASHISHLAPEDAEPVSAHYEVAESLLSKPDAIELLRRASTS
ncbi:MAG: hypothetical protein CSA72_04920 [Rhodobacterales bacterium]|nr:MAG: hypothetical protein CSA72_04920 [Rhodobacterales bacterium]